MNDYHHSDLSEYQKKCLAILLEFDRICAEYGIRYSLLYGTVLGAVRHRGFIPWDDDIDVGVPRPDYERLLSLVDELAPPYVFEQFVVGGTYIHPFAKIYDSSTTVIEFAENPFKRGVWIDVFPLDGTFSNGFLQHLHIKSINIINRLFSLSTGRYPIKEKLSLRKVCRNILTPIARIIPISIIYWSFSKLAKLVDYKDASYIANLYSIYGMRQIMPANYIKSPENRMIFCGLLFPVPSDPGEYLRTLYGDYMALPPPHERVGHKTHFIDLGIPYGSSDVQIPEKD